MVTCSMGPIREHSFSKRKMVREDCSLEFAVQFAASSIVLFSTALPVIRIGGHLLGRYWYKTH
jgi:hypothetical protein